MVRYSSPKTFTAAAPEIPPALVAQLRVGGRLVMPVGAVHGAQTLMRGVRMAEGGLALRACLGVRFVRLTGAAGDYIGNHNSVVLDVDNHANFGN